MKLLNRENNKTRGILILSGIFLLVIAAHRWWPDRQMLPLRSVSALSDLSTPQSVILNGIAIDINTASEEQLAAIPNLGKAKARAVVAFREEKGTFRTLRDILDVPGIGLKTLEKTKMHLKVINAEKNLK